MASATRKDVRICYVFLMLQEDQEKLEEEEKPAHANVVIRVGTSSRENIARVRRKGFTVRAPFARDTIAQHRSVKCRDSTSLYHVRLLKFILLFFSFPSQNQ